MVTADRPRSSVSSDDEMNTFMKKMAPMRRIVDLHHPSLKHTTVMPLKISDKRMVNRSRNGLVNIANTTSHKTQDWMNVEGQ